MENIVHIVRSHISEEDLIDIVDKVSEVNFETIMDIDEDALSKDGSYNSDQSEDQREDTKSKK